MKMLIMPFAFLVSNPSCYHFYQKLVFDYQTMHYFSLPLISYSESLVRRIRLLVLFLYIILYPHSLQRIGSLDFISFSV